MEPKNTAQECAARAFRQRYGFDPAPADWQIDEHGRPGLARSLADAIEAAVHKERQRTARVRERPVARGRDEASTRSVMGELPRQLLPGPCPRLGRDGQGSGSRHWTLPRVMSACTESHPSAAAAPGPAAR